MTKPRFSRLALHNSRPGAARKLIENAPSGGYHTCLIDPAQNGVTQ
jgi:hypothetical protein